MAMAKRNYTKLLKNTRAWQDCCKRLSYSADAIMDRIRSDIHKFGINWPKNHQIPGRLLVAQGLYGQALEAGLKARVIHRDKSLCDVTEKGKLRWNIEGVNSGHELLALAQATNFLDAHRDTSLPDLLYFLWKHIEWISRYPVPMKIIDMKWGFTGREYKPGVLLLNIDLLVTPMLEDLQRPLA
jgi:hypothetical protein